jgi:hypothetical protein
MGILLFLFIISSLTLFDLEGQCKFVSPTVMGVVVTHHTSGLERATE